MEGRKQSINLDIAGKSYGFSVDSSEEEILREAANKVKKLILKIEERYVLTSREDKLTIVVLDLAKQLVELEVTNQQRSMATENIKGELEFLNKQIDEYIESNMN